MHVSSYGYIPEIDPDAFRADSERMLETALEEVFGPHRPARLSTRLLRGRPAELLIEESRNARMLVVGPRGVGGVLGMIMGSVSAALVAHAHCPVLVVRR
jgi:nucleotide-binding universal stress UspA family protein